ncbi:MAG TPA: hypothetical protein DCQ14_00015 [Firmicutes bacterium]|nr:hypothetical protein [Bacillota bacterium]
MAGRWSPFSGWPAKIITFPKPITFEVAYLQKAAREKSREKNEVMLRHFTALQQALMPMGVLQERVLNIIPFLCKYGPTFWHKLQQEFPLTPGHYLFYS